MTFAEWIVQRLGSDTEPLRGGGADLAAALSDVLVERGYDYGQQKELLYEATGLLHDLDFGNACLDRIAAIEAYEQRRAAVRVKTLVKCRSGVMKNKQWGAGAEYASLRFAAARPVDETLCDLVDDMLKRLVADGYLEVRQDLVRDLRQGLGYYRDGEDVFRPRRTARWLRGQNVLHVWVVLMKGGRDPLIRVERSGAGCWEIAASLFVDRMGKAFTNSRLEHGKVESEEELRYLRSLVPRPSTTVASRERMASW